MISFLQVDVHCHADVLEILIAEMANIGYDSFWEKEQGGFAAYIDEYIYNEQQILDLFTNYKFQNKGNITFEVTKMENKNWNKEWETNFEPILITNQCYVRATFHAPRPDIKLEIIIDPKMSFGTGHHATTSMMLQHLLKNNVHQKSVMDVGCGTGILSIAAHKLGASSVFGFDIEDWTVENAFENKLLNGIENNLHFLECTIQTMPQQNQKYDFVLANINRNVLLEEIKLYANYLKNDAKLIISGFYTEDVVIIDEEAQKIGLEIIEKLVENNWCSLVYKQKMVS